MPTAEHLAAALRIVSKHIGTRRASIEQAHDAVKRAAWQVGVGAVGPETQALIDKLEKATGCSIAELAVDAEDWPAQ